MTDNNTEIGSNEFDIAVIGMSGRFPGAENVDTFWQNISSGRESISFFSDDELIDEGVDPGVLADPNYVKAAPVLDSPDLFDASFFDYSPREAKLMDPQHRLFLECAWEALENAGCNANQYSGAIAVYAGAAMNTYMMFNGTFFNNISEHLPLLIASDKDFLATRVSYKLNLKGPSVTIQTACSTSLVAVHIACQSLLNGECDVALAGGVTVLVPHKAGYIFQEGTIRSSDGHCRAFDAKAEGTVFGSGVGIVVLKRLKDAITDRDCIHAVIKGSAINNDGASKAHYTAPSVDGQAEAIVEALSNAEIEPDTISYLEAHGTGTALGDPIEIAALTHAFRTYTDKKGFCAIGSVKTNIGHLDAAAGVAGLIKTILAVKHRMIPPSLHFEAPNPEIDFENSPFYVSTALHEWKPSQHPRRAGINSLGVGGTNAHFVIEEPPEVQLQREEMERPLQLLALSAKCEKALLAMAGRYADHLATHPDDRLTDICFTANAGRAHFDYRLAAVGETPSQIQRCLRDFAEGKDAAEVISGRVEGANGVSAAFLFTGQGSQYLGMGRRLYESQPTFRTVLNECDELLRPYTQHSLVTMLYRSSGAEAEENLKRTAHTQPALFAIEYALAQLWRSWGVEPAVVMGHSVGEYVAACLAGVFCLEDGLKLIAHRGRLMDSLPSDGLMAAVFADHKRVAQLLADYPRTVSIAAINGPANTVISGAKADVTALLERFKAKGIEATALMVSHAFHSPLMEPMLSEFERVATEVTYSPPQLELISNVTGQLAADEEISQAGYWVRHVRQPVHFAKSIQTLWQQGERLYLECGPHPVLLGMGRQCVSADGGKWLPSLRRGRDDWRQMLESLSTLYLHGLEVDWAGFDRDYPRRKLSLPTYPFQRKRYWIKVQKSTPGGEKEQTSDTEKAIQSLLFEVSWPPAASDGSSTAGSEVFLKNWLILADGRGVASSLAEKIQQNGGNCILVFAGDCFKQLSNRQFYIDPHQQKDYGRLLKISAVANRDTAFGIIHLWSLDTGMSPDTQSAEILASDRQYLCGSVLNFFKVLDTYQFLKRARLWVVTRGAQSAEAGHLPNVAQSPLWGFGRTLMLEHPEFLKGLIDLEGVVSDNEAQQIFNEIKSNDGECQVRYIRGNRHVARLNRASDSAAKPLSILPTKTYLITGGLGALGLRVAGWLAAKGARNLVLCGRSEPSDFTTEQLNRLKQTGCQLAVRKVDVSRQKEVISLCHDIARAMPPLHGVVHAAGVLDDGVLLNQSWERFEKVMKPKAIGAWNLHLATRNLDLGFFILFSSAASILGAAGQGNYAAANAFLNALVSYRDQQGLSAHAIAWGPWSNGGMASNLDQHNQTRFEKSGLRMISPEVGLEILDHAIGKINSQFCVLDADWPVFLNQFPSEPIRRFLSFISKEFSVDEALEPIAQSQKKKIDQWNELDAEQGLRFLEDYLLERVSRTTGLERVKLTVESNFFDLNMDSLMIMEVINSIRKDFDLSLYAREVFEKPTIYDLSRYIESELNRNTRSKPSAKPSGQTSSGVLSLANISRKRSNSPPEERNPSMIFLLSSPRAGSTLLRVMLEGHSQLFCPPELHLLPFDNLKERRYSLGKSYLTEGLERAFMELKGIDAAESQDLLESLLESDTSVQDIYRLLQENAYPRLLVDKSPAYAFNLETLEWAELIFECPKYIHLTRHPFSVIESFTRARMERLLGIQTDDPIKQAEQMWSETNANIIDFCEGLDPSRHQLVHYEELVQNPEKVMQDLCTFLGLPFEESLLKPYEGNRMTDGLHSRSIGIGDPNFLNHDSIDASFANSWKKFSLGRKPSGFVRRVAKELGYHFPEETTDAEKPLELPGSSPRGLTIQAAKRDTKIPLSFQQQRLWFLEQLEPGNVAYNMPGLVFRLKGALNEFALRKSLDEIIQRHEILRTTFDGKGGNPIQVIASRCPLDLKTIDLDGEPSSLREKKALDLVVEELKHPFDLQSGPLMRAVLISLNPEDFILALPIHHIVSDGWSFGVFLREFSDLYNTFCSGKSVHLPDLTIQYADFAVWQRQWLQGEVMAAQVAYWKRQLKGEVPVLQLPTDRLRPTVQTNNGAKESFILPRSLNKQLKKLSQREGVTLFMTLLAAFKTLLHRYTGQEDFAVGSPIANRNRAELEGLIGFFVNTLVLRTDMSKNPRFVDLLKRVREVTLGAYDHQDMPFEKLVEELQPARDMRYSPLFQVMFALQSVRIKPAPLTELVLTPVAVDIETSMFDLTLIMREEADELSAVVEYNTDLFDRTTIARMLRHFQKLLESIIVDPEQRISDLPLLPETEHHQLLVDWNDTAADYNRDKCIHELFLDQVKKSPEHAAVMSEGQQLTYRQLNCRANRLAHYLQSLGVGPDVLVGINMERSVEMIVGILGILKASGGYLPLDPMYPKDRLAHMLGDSQAKVLLTQASLASDLTDKNIQKVCLDADWPAIEKHSDQNPINIATPQNLAYVIYTSGSTGIPKGVMIEHKSVVNYIESASAEFELEAADRVLQFASISFDAAAEEIYPCLVQGATLVLRTDTMVSSMSEFLAACRDTGITVLDLPTAFWHQMVSDMTDYRLNLPETLRLVIVGGERALAEQVADWQKIVARSIRLLNTYGPTEATIVATNCDLTEITLAELSHEVPIGKPIPNVQTYILDANLHPVSIGVPGELHIGGDGLARGYLNRPELTAAKFIANPFSDEPGARLYKTGDLVRYLPDGNIEFLGRIDYQVKVRGYRIELGEVETVLRQHPAVRDVIVIACEDNPGENRLVAYLIAEEKPGPTTTELRIFLKEKLPDYMIPSVFCTLDEFPLTPSKKVDRKALPELKNLRPNLEVAYVAPRSPTEELLAGIWTEVLGVEKVGLYDNFFDLGGHSLLTTKVVSRLRESDYSIDLPIRKLFEYPTLEAFAEQVTLSLIDDEKISDLIEEVKNLSDEDIDRKLKEMS